MTDGLRAEIAARNQRLLPYKRISGYVVWEEDFPRTASLKIKRGVLAEQIRPETRSRRRDSAVSALIPRHRESRGGRRALRPAG